MKKQTNKFLKLLFTVCLTLKFSSSEAMNPDRALFLLAKPTVNFVTGLPYPTIDFCSWIWKEYKFWKNDLSYLYELFESGQEKKAQKFKKRIRDHLLPQSHTRELINLIEQIAKNEVDIDDTMALCFAYALENLELVKLFLEKKNADPSTIKPAGLAVRRRNIETLKLLIENGLDVNKKAEDRLVWGDTLLHAVLSQAVRNKNEYKKRFAILKLMVESGANIDKESICRRFRRGGFDKDWKREEHLCILNYFVENGTSLMDCDKELAGWLPDPSSRTKTATLFYEKYNKQKKLEEKLKNPYGIKKEELQNCFKQAVFNHRFLTKDEFKKARIIALQCNLKDKNGHSLPQAVALYLTDTFQEDRHKLISFIFENFSAKSIIEELEKATQLAKRFKRRRAFRELRNSLLVFKDFTKDENRTFVADVVPTIMAFADTEDLAGKMIFGKKYSTKK